jgi:phosphate transport system regulatory protein PhoU
MKYLNAYDKALIDINSRLLEMGEAVNNHLGEAMNSFVNQDADKAKSIIDGDEAIDSLEESLEMDSLELISLQQPIDRDLRFLAAVMRIGRELERINDYACDIAKLVLELQPKAPFFKPLIDLPHMAELVQSMMEKSLAAYAKRDLTPARQLDADDDQVDGLFEALMKELTGYMKKGPEYVDQASRLLLATRYLERIGDHIVNIAEMVIFIDSGERHPFKNQS